MAHEHSIVIIGNGVAANVLGFTLRDQSTTRDCRLTQIYHDRSYRPCSQSTTSHVCLRNTQRGVSPLGDLLVEAFETFGAFAKQHAPSGVYPCDHVHLWRPDSQQAANFFRRYEGLSFKGDSIEAFTHRFPQVNEMARNVAYVVDPTRYRDFLRDRTGYDRVIEDGVMAIKGRAVELASGANVTFDRLFLCTGQFTHAFTATFADPTHLQRSKPVAGTYMEFDLADFKREEFSDCSRAFCLDVEDVNLVYRPQAQTVLLGATSTNDSDSYAPDLQILERYEKVQGFLAGAFTLPAAEKARMITGVRHKGHRRRPFWGEIAPHVYAVYGLYKNGFMTANLAAKALVEGMGR